MSIEWKQEHGFHWGVENGITYRVSKDLAPSGKWRAFILEPKGIEFNAPCSSPDFGKKFCEFFSNHITTLISTAKKQGQEQHIRSQSRAKCGQEY